MTVTYDGSGFFGFQYQKDRPTVQGTLEQALSTILSEQVRVHGSGRTDAGVHALGQVVAFATRCPIPLDKLTIAINGTLPASVRVRELAEVPADFHPRFCATGKHYRYLVREGAEPSPIYARFLCQIEERLDPAAVGAGMHGFLGRHDFSAFAQSPARYDDPVRTILAAEARRHESIWVFDFVGDGFLHNQVRNMAKCLLLIGGHHLEPSAIGELYRNRDRRTLGPPAPAGGLYLMRVMY